MGFLNDEWKWRSSWIFWYALKHIRWCNGACHQLSCWCAKSVRCIDTIAIFIIDWPTIWIRITWVNRIHFVSISCVFDVFRSFCKILHNLQTKSNAVAFNWSGFLLFKCWKISRFNLNICWSLSPMNGAVSIFFFYLSHETQISHTIFLNRIFCICFYFVHPSRTLIKFIANWWCYDLACYRF